MILIKKDGNPSAKEVLVIMEDEDDEMFIMWLDYQNIVFGMWKVYLVALDQQRQMDEGKWLAKHYPTAKGLARINATEFIGKPKDGQIKF